MQFSRRIPAAIVVLAFVLQTTPGLAAGASTPQKVEATVSLAGGSTATVYASGLVRITGENHVVTYRTLPWRDRLRMRTETPAELRTDARLHIDLSRPPRGSYAPGELVVVLKDSFALNDRVVLDGAHIGAMRRGQLVPVYTNDRATNLLFARLGVDAMHSVFSRTARMRLSAMRVPGRLDLANAYVLHVGAPMRYAAAALAQMPTIAYVTPNWYVAPMNVPGAPIPRDVAARIATMGTGASQPVDVEPGHWLPNNSSLQYSAQSLLNAPGVDAAAAFDEIDHAFHQLPGEGERITDVSLGSISDERATTNAEDSCYNEVTVEQAGATTELVGGQHYIDWPTLPLIPVFTADPSGNLSGNTEVCVGDPTLDEIGLDLSVMAPLPDRLQRPRERGRPFGANLDLLGIAPGAQYSVVVPANADPTIADIDSALFGAAEQTPRPDVITMSLGFGFDALGFPSRYIEEDPLTQTLVASIVHSMNIVVCVSAGDGTRLETNAAVGPSGGSVATNLPVAGATPTSTLDDERSTIASIVPDSGSIDAGAVTLDDIFACPPQDPANRACRAQHAFPETRWDGAQNFASGWGTRVDLSAPGDDILAMQHIAISGRSVDAVGTELNGGSSAAAPEVAAAAAIALQVARLTGRPFTRATDVRAFLESTANAVPNVSQSDVANSVGPQIDVTRSVERLLANAGHVGVPGVARIAIALRQQPTMDSVLDTAFFTATDPVGQGFQNGGIDLAFPRSAINSGFTTGDAIGWLTMAPDWENLPPNATFQLLIEYQGRHRVIATTRYAREQPIRLFALAGRSFSRTPYAVMQFTYNALVGRRIVASIPFTIDFSNGGGSAGVQGMSAPLAPPIVTGETIPVTYDLTGVSSVSNPVLVVSQPGRPSPIAVGGPFPSDYLGWYTTDWNPAYTTPLPSQKGVISVPVSALHGGGIYGIGIQYGTARRLGVIGGPGFPLFSDFATTRVEVGSAARPAAPLLSNGRSAGMHDLEIPYGGSFTVGWDVTNVPDTTGALLELSAPAPVLSGSYNTFNNPNGSTRDADGVDTGSIYVHRVGTRKGSLTIDARAVGLSAAMAYTIRVIPLKGQQGAGEAGDVSTVTMDGIVPSDAGSIANGFGVSAGGSSGFLTSNSIAANGDELGSIETFDQQTGAIAGTNVSSCCAFAFYTLGWGIWGGTTGVIGVRGPTGPSLLPPFALMTPIAPATTLATAWNNPFSGSASLQLNAVAANPQSTTLALLTQTPDASNPQGNDFSVYGSDLATNTLSKPASLTSALTNLAQPYSAGFVQNPATGIVTAVFSDQSNLCSVNPLFVSVNLATGSLSTIANTTTTDAPGGLALDPTTGATVMSDICNGNLDFFNLTTGAAATLTPDNAFDGFSPAADPARHRFVVGWVAGPNLYTDNNAASIVQVYGENGGVYKTIRGFNFANVPFAPATNLLQLDPVSHTGFVPGPNATEIERFSY